MADESDPPRKFYQLKPKEFERVNEPPAAPTEPAPASGSRAAPTNPGGRIDVHDLLAQASTPGPILSQPKTPAPSNDVHAMLRDNLARADAAGANALAPKPRRRSRRKRDYFLALISVNAFLGYFAFGPHANAVTFVYGVGGMVFFSCGLTWVMWFVVEDY